MKSAIIGTSIANRFASVWDRIDPWWRALARIRAKEARIRELEKQVRALKRELGMVPLTTWLTRAKADLACLGYEEALAEQKRLHEEVADLRRALADTEALATRMTRENAEMFGKVQGWIREMRDLTAGRMLGSGIHDALDDLERLLRKPEASIGQEEVSDG